MWAALPNKQSSLLHEVASLQGVVEVSRYLMPATMPRGHISKPTQTIKEDSKGLIFPHRLCQTPPGHRTLKSKLHFANYNNFQIDILTTKIQHPPVLAAFPPVLHMTMPSPTLPSYAAPDRTTSSRCRPENGSPAGDADPGGAERRAAATWAEQPRRRDLGTNPTATLVV